MVGRRIAVVQASKTFNSRNGITTALENLLGFCNKNNIFVDLILDKWKDTFKIELNYPNVKIWFPENPLDDTKEKHRAGQFEYPISLETNANIREAYFAACQEGIHDFVFVNSEECLLGLMYIGIKTPIYLYTHFGHMLPDCNAMIKTANWLIYPNKDNFEVLTQTEENLDILIKQGYSKARVLPLLPTQDIFPIDCEKNGVLWNGRLSAQKRFPDYCEVIKMTGKKALIMTPVTVSEVETVLKKYDITDYEIGNNLLGEARNAFMNKAECCFHPSETESFGYAPAESCMLHDTYIMKYPWTVAIEKLGATRCDTLAEVAHKINNDCVNPNREAMVANYKTGIEDQWLQLIEHGRETIKARGKTVQANLSHPMYLKDLFKAFGRKIAYSDVDSVRRQVFANYDYVQTEHGTWIGSLEPAPVGIVCTKSLEGLENFLT